MEQCNNTTSGLAISSTVASIWSGKQTSSNVPNANDGSCTLVWRCEACRLDPAASGVTLRLRSPMRSWVSYVSYTLQLPAFSQSADVNLTKTTSSAAVADASLPFAISGSFYAPGTSATNMSAVRGEFSTTVSLFLTPYLKASAAGVTTDVAFLPSLIGLQFATGSTLTPAAFAFHDATGFSIDFVLERSSLSLRSTQAKNPVINFIVLLASLLGSLLSIYTIVLGRLEAVLGLQASPLDAANVGFLAADDSLTDNLGGKSESDVPLHFADQDVAPADDMIGSTSTAHIELSSWKSVHETDSAAPTAAEMTQLQATLRELQACDAEHETQFQKQETMLLLQQERIAQLLAMLTHAELPAAASS